MVRTIIFSVLSVVVIIFVIQNTSVVTFHFLAWSFSISRALMLFGTFLAGVVGGWFFKRVKQRAKVTGR